MQDEFLGPFKRRPALALLFVVLTYAALLSVAGPPRLQRSLLFISRAKILVKTNPERSDLPGWAQTESGEATLLRWFVDPAAIPKLVREPRFLAKVAEIVDEEDAASLASSLQAFPTTRGGPGRVGLLERTEGSLFEDMLEQENEDTVFLLEGDSSNALELASGEERVDGRSLATGNARFIQFIALGNTPEQSRQRVLALMTVFKREGLKLLAGDIVDTRQLVEKQVKRLELRVRAQSNDVDHSVLEQDFLQNLIDEKQAKIESLRSELAQLRPKLKSRVSPRTGENDPLLAVSETLKKEVLELAALRQQFREGSEILRRQEELVSGLERLEQDIVSEREAAIKHELNAKIYALEERLAATEREMQSLVRESLNVDELQEANAQMRQLKVLEDNLYHHKQQLLNLGLAEKTALERGSFTIVHEPGLGERPAPPRSRSRDPGFPLGLFVASVCLGFLLVVIWETIFLRPRFLERVEETLELPVPGVLPPRSPDASRKWDRWKREALDQRSHRQESTDGE